MKTATFSLNCLVLCVGISASAQGTFQNLGFESAVLVPIPGDPYGRVQFATAFPGWTGYVGGDQQTAALYNDVFLDTSAISIIDSNWPGFLGVRGPIEGRFTAILQAGLGVGPTPPADTALAQTGLVPAGTQSLQFRGFQAHGSGVFEVSLGGQTLSLVPLLVTTNYTIFGADIHSWAGQTAELRFTQIADRPHQVNQYLFLDSIQFSDQAVPEPSAVGLAATAVVLVGWRLARQRR